MFHTKPAISPERIWCQSTKLPVERSAVTLFRLPLPTAKLRNIFKSTSLVFGPYLVSLVSFCVPAHHLVRPHRPLFLSDKYSRATQVATSLPDFNSGFFIKKSSATALA